MIRNDSDTRECPAWCSDAGHRFEAVSETRAFRVHNRVIGTAESGQDMFGKPEDTTAVRVATVEDLDIGTGLASLRDPVVMVDDSCFTIEEARALVGLLCSAIEVAA